MCCWSILGCWMCLFAHNLATLKSCASILSTSKTQHFHSVLFFHLLLASFMDKEVVKMWWKWEATTTPSCSDDRRRRPGRRSVCYSGNFIRTGRIFHIKRATKKKAPQAFLCGRHVPALHLTGFGNSYPNAAAHHPATGWLKSPITLIELLSWLNYRNKSDWSSWMGLKDIYLITFQVLPPL